ncbi:MAG TPA: F0F1 ATP synthase subunit A [Candidatus Saccharimonadales bacterium]|nr:F0F1 ATP synthase subunit A [Candidatus Saccharimonadales bacterium]
MFNALTFFGAEGGVPLAAQTIFSIGSFNVTNSMLFGVITGAAVVLILLAAVKKSHLKPTSMFSFTLETIAEFILNTAEEGFNSRKKALKHLPFLLSLFCFILLANLSGLIPGVGTIVVNTEHGEVSLLRAFTTDLNGTIALAVLSIGLVQFYALKELGILGHLKNYFTNKPYNPINLFMGLIEVMGEFIRIITLSMRLFGVIYAGEVLLHVIGQLAGAFGWAATVPVYFLELFFSAIQAYIFVMLTTAYLNMATSSHGEHSEHESDHSKPAKLKTAAANES